MLPAWAKNDPGEFIRAHREALECDFVSSRLHEWIDLIFGYKQQEPAAVGAVNVFHHLFYEGNVNIYDIDDPLKKNAIIGFINNFGQIPKQVVCVWLCLWLFFVFVCVCMFSCVFVRVYHVCIFCVAFCMCEHFCMCTCVCAYTYI